MKKYLLFLFLIPLLISCTNYYSVTLEKDTILYKAKNGKDSSSVIPANTQVYLSKKKTKYRKIKVGNYKGWANEPIYTLTTTKVTNTGTAPSYHSRKSNSSASGGSVQVKGYTRKDGTYVKPHTRSAPKKH